jgi:hypothetical protein
VVFCPLKTIPRKYHDGENFTVQDSFCGAGLSSRIPDAAHSGMTPKFLQIYVALQKETCVHSQLPVRLRLKRPALFAWADKIRASEVKTSPRKFRNDDKQRT